MGGAGSARSAGRMTDTRRIAEENYAILATSKPRRTRRRIERRRTYSNIGRRTIASVLHYSFAFSLESVSLWNPLPDRIFPRFCYILNDNSRFCDPRATWLGLTLHLEITLILRR